MSEGVNEEDKAALVRFAENVGNALEGYETASCLGRQECLSRAVSATARLLTDMHAHDFARPLADLAVAMHDLTLGISHPLTARPTLKGRIPERSNLWMARAAASVALDVLYEGGKSLKKASEEIAKEQRWLKDVTGKKTRNTEHSEVESLARAIVNWRDRFSRNKYDNTFGCRVWARAGGHRAEVRRTPVASRLDVARRLAMAELEAFRPQ